ncbi:MAG: secretin N-terminal domain-containing protein [Bryobacteraceae bacterium]|jgi:hypothetical protein
MKRALVVLAALFAAGAWAQQAPVRIFTVKAANAERIQRVVKTVVADSGFVALDSASSTLVVEASPVLLAAVEQVVKELDAASTSAKNVELTFYILEATKEPAADAAPLPAELQPAIAQLKSVFAYRGFRLLDTALIRSRSGESADASGQAQVEGGTSGYNLHLQPSVASETAPATIRIDNLHFQQWMKGTNVGFSANVDLKEGQRAVIGKTSMEGSRSAFILVASGRIVE